MKDGTWRVRVPVSPALVPYLGRRNGHDRIKAANQEEADTLAGPWIAKFQAEIAEAERQRAAMSALVTPSMATLYFLSDRGTVSEKGKAVTGHDPRVRRKRMD